LNKAEGLASNKGKAENCRAKARNGQKGQQMATPTPYKVHFTNFGYSNHYVSEQAARDAIKRSGFEASIWFAAKRIASFTIFGGWRNFSE